MRISNYVFRINLNSFVFSFFFYFFIKEFFVSSDPFCVLCTTNAWWENSSYVKKLNARQDCRNHGEKGVWNEFSRVNRLSIENDNEKVKIVKRYKLIEVSQTLLLIIISIEPFMQCMEVIFKKCNTFYTLFLCLFYQSIYHFEKLSTIKDFSIRPSSIEIMKSWISLLCLYCFPYLISFIRKEPLKGVLWNGCPVQLCKIHETQTKDN